MAAVRLLALHALGRRCKARRVRRCALARGRHPVHIDARGDVWVNTDRLNATSVLEDAGERMREVASVCTCPEELIGHQAHCPTTRAYREVTDG